MVRSLFPLAAAVRGRFPRSLRTFAVTIALVGVAGVALVAGAGDRGEAQQIDLGDENSWIRIQNVGEGPASIDIDFFDSHGVYLATDSCPSGGGCAEIRSGFGWSFFQQFFGDLPEGFRGSAFIESDQPFVAMLARDVYRPATGELQISGDTLRLGAGTSVHYMPLVQDTARYISRITVQNPSDLHAICVEISYYESGSTSPTTVDPSTPGAGCSLGGELVEARATMLRDEFSLPVPFGFDGAAVLRTYDSDAGIPAEAQRPAVIVDTRDRTQAGLATYRAIGQDEAARVVLLPLVDRNASEGESTWSTRFRIMSANPSIPTEVTLLFDGTDAVGDRLEFEHTITVIGARTCDQDFAGALGCLPEGTALPSTFFGTVRMQSVQPIAVVGQRRSPDGSLADYRGFTAQDASTRVVVPVTNKNFNPWLSGDGWNSWFRVLTFDGSVAGVSVIYFSKAFPTGLKAVVGRAVVGSRTFRQQDERQLPSDWVGAAVIIASRPIVVIANLESDSFEGDPVMLYNAVPLE